MDSLPRPDAYDRGNGSQGWYSNQKSGWEKFRGKMNKINDNPSPNFDQPKVVAKRVLLALETEGGALIEGVRHGQGGVVSTPEEVRELAKYEHGEVQSLYPIRDALKVWMNVLKKYPAPAFILRTSRGIWSQTKGLGFSKIAGPVSPQWLDVQTEAFRKLINSLDVLSEDTQADPEICEAAINVAGDLTKPGGPKLFEVPTWDAGGQPRQSPIGGPGAHYMDVMNTYHSHTGGNIDVLDPPYRVYIDSLRHPDMPFYIAASSRGYHAQRRWSWYKPQLDHYHMLIRDIKLLGNTLQCRQLIAKLEDPSQGILLQGASKLPSGGPGANWLDVLAMLKTEGYDPVRCPDP